MNQDYHHKIYLINKKSLFIITIVLSVFSVDAQTNLDSNYTDNDRIKLIENRMDTLYIQNVRYIREYENAIKGVKASIDSLKEKASIDSISIKDQLSLMELSIKNKLSSLESSLKKNEKDTKESSRQIIRLTKELEAINSSISGLINKNTNLDTFNQELAAEIKSVINTLGEKGIEIDNLKDSISKKQLYWIIIIAVLMLLLILVYLILERKRAADKEDLLKKHTDIFEKQIEDSYRLAEWLENQSQTKLGQQDGLAAEIDHSFAKRVADEIVKNNANLSRMDESIKGHKQLKRSMHKLEKTLSANGYELIDMFNMPYNEGMNVIATFVPDDTLEDGEAIISRIIKPHISYKGKMIQAAEVQVSQG